MVEIQRFEKEPGENFYSVHLEVKKRFIDPLVKLPQKNPQRVSSLSSRAQKSIQNLLNFKDSSYGGVRLF